MTRIISRSYGSFMTDLQHFLFLKNGGQRISLTGSDVIYNMVRSADCDYCACPAHLGVGPGLA